QPAMTQKGRVSPFGDPRIKGCSPLPAAFRSVPRPSSPLSAKASTKCPYALDPKLFRRTQRADPLRNDSFASTSYSALHFTRLAIARDPLHLKPKLTGSSRPRPGNPCQRPVAFLSTMSKIQRTEIGRQRTDVLGLSTSPNSRLSLGCRPALVEPTGIEPVTPCLQSRC